MSHAGTTHTEPVQILSGSARLEGELSIPAGATSVVLFAHGSGSSRRSPRNHRVARVIREHGIGTLLFDLLTAEEESEDLRTGRLRFDIRLLAVRLMDATRWIVASREFPDLRVAYFGASTGGGAALAAAAAVGTDIGAVVSRGGRPDLAGEALERVESPTLLIVGALDREVIRLNQEAYARLRCRKELNIVAGASHLFEEPGTLEQVAKLASAWFEQHLKRA